MKQWVLLVVLFTALCGSIYWLQAPGSVVEPVAVQKSSNSVPETESTAPDGPAYELLSVPGEAGNRQPDVASEGSLLRGRVLFPAGASHE